MFTRYLFCLVTLGFFTSANGFAQKPEAVRHWSYSDATGPEHWSELDPKNSACSIGREESPIDLEGAATAALTPLVFDYHAAPWQVVDNGHTVQVIVAPGSYLTADGHKYELVQFHFHHPSEEAIAGKHFDMVIHLVHKDTEGHLAVVAILLADGKASPLIQAVWDNQPKTKEEVKKVDSLLDPMQLIPTGNGYYAFKGSLTTPPCTEGVQWFVMKSPTEISVGQERTFAALYPNNARPLQPRNGRKVEVSK